MSRGRQFALSPTRSPGTLFAAASVRREALVVVELILRPAHHRTPRAPEAGRAHTSTTRRPVLSVMRAGGRRRSLNDHHTSRSHQGQVDVHRV